MIVVFIVFFNGKAKIQSRQNRKDIGLQKSHQYFDDGDGKSQYKLKAGSNPAF